MFFVDFQTNLWSQLRVVRFAGGAAQLRVVADDGFGLLVGVGRHVKWCRRFDGNGVATLEELSWFWRIRCAIGLGRKAAVAGQRRGVWVQGVLVVGVRYVAWNPTYISSDFTT